ncbi:hypothetical protein C8R47DRAFT_1214114 [Mycena vitilis]|nr:hypothetical protein C8R47DRAFT_1214114 [Mycena vitilis]
MPFRLLDTSTHGHRSGIIASCTPNDVSLFLALLLLLLIPSPSPFLPCPHPVPGSRLTRSNTHIYIYIYIYICIRFPLTAAHRTRIVSYLPHMHVSSYAIRNPDLSARPSIYDKRQASSVKNSKCFSGTGTGVELAVWTLYAGRVSSFSGPGWDSISGSRCDWEGFFKHGAQRDRQVQVNVLDE